MNELLMEPLKYYEKTGKREHEDHTQEHFDTLLSESGVDVEANRQTVKELNLEHETIKKISSKISRYKTLRTILIIAVIALVVLAKVQERLVVGRLVVDHPLYLHQVIL